VTLVLAWAIASSGMSIGFLFGVWWGTTLARADRDLDDDPYGDGRESE
jgi:hypothetical protein